MIETLLIANRGEIACRVIRTARRLGMRTVAVFSDADRDARHVREADEAVRIGPAAAADSYLSIAAIVDAAQATGADAVHPGYGFLSENPAFVEAVEAAGFVFVGPSAEAIRAMGLKDAAKRLMEESGVPVVPGYHGERQDAEFLEGEARRIGFPVLIKARAGGGGKGMRRVDRAEDFAEALAGAQREAKSAFGDSACLVERYVASPRHIEVQVFGDRHGNVVHLFERDCSLQRRHQKVIEEAPAPGMTAEMRAAMGEAAVRAAKAVGYHGAGTVEFIVDGSEGLRADRFFFMEMNTRLQVEHPVTEAITGLDLVEWQLRVADGEPLPLRQDELEIHGHAVEARIYAEDVPRGFLPATGRLRHLRFPAGPRIDSGVAEGDAVTPFYDPMIAKMITHGETRTEALARLAAALDQTEIAGVTTNTGFLARLARHPDFAAGRVDTGLIQRDLGDLAAPPAAEAADFALAAIALAEPDETSAASDPWDRHRDFRLFGPAVRRVALEGADGPAVLSVETEGDTRRVAASGNKLEFRRVADGFCDAVGSKRGWSRSDTEIAVFRGADTLVFRTADPARPRESTGGADAVFAPMPGTVRLVGAAVGDEVEKGAVLVVVEAMKMEHALRAPRAGRLATVAVALGDQVEDGSMLAELEPLA